MVITMFRIGFSGLNLLSGAKTDRSHLHALFSIYGFTQSCRAVKCRNEGSQTLKVAFLRINLSLDVSFQEGLVRNILGN